MITEVSDTMSENRSVEDYLETILVLSRRLPEVRSIDIAEEMNFTKASVSVSMKNLRTKGYIDMDKSKYITLTESGRRIAENILERHELISNWLVHLGVDKETALEDACRMEHTLSEETYEAIKRHVIENNEVSLKLRVQRI